MGQIEELGEPVPLATPARGDVFIAFSAGDYCTDGGNENVGERIKCFAGASGVAKGRRSGR